MESVKREEPLKESERRGIIIGVLAAMLLAALDQTIVAPALVSGSESHRLFGLLANPD